MVQQLKLICTFWALLIWLLLLFDFEHTKLVRYRSDIEILINPSQNLPQIYFLTVKAHFWRLILFMTDIFLNLLYHL